MLLERAPGIVRGWPTTRIGSVSWLTSTISAASAWYLAANVSSVSLVATVTTTPFTGGIVSHWPTVRSFLLLRWFAHHTVIIDTWNLEAIPVRVSPEWTRYVRSRSAPSATV